jgi:hypothetical protein
LRDLIQRIALEDRHCGYRRVTHALRRQGLTVNAKRVLRLDARGQSAEPTRQAVRSANHRQPARLRGSLQSDARAHADPTSPMFGSPRRSSFWRW